jgi:hypothetical protein
MIKYDKLLNKKQKCIHCGLYYLKNPESCDICNGYTYWEEDNTIRTTAKRKT